MHWMTQEMPVSKYVFSAYGAFNYMCVASSSDCTWNKLNKLVSSIVRDMLRIRQKVVSFVLKNAEQGEIVS